MKTLLTLGTGLVLLTLGTGSWRAASAAQDPAAPGIDARLATLEGKVAALENKRQRGLRSHDREGSFRAERRRQDAGEVERSKLIEVRSR